jgi:hypothetical protein
MCHLSLCQDELYSEDRPPFDQVAGLTRDRTRWTLCTFDRLLCILLVYIDGTS